MVWCVGVVLGDHPCQCVHGCGVGGHLWVCAWVWCWGVIRVGVCMGVVLGVICRCVHGCGVGGHLCGWGCVGVVCMGGYDLFIILNHLIVLICRNP